MSDNVIQASFSGGEFTPSFFGRTDTNQYRIGAALVRNFFVDYRGGVSNRSGQAFVMPQRDSTKPGRIEGFRFSAKQNYILLFGDFTMQVIVNGAAALEPAFTVTGITFGAVTTVNATGHNYIVGDSVYLNCPSTPELQSGYYIIASVTSAAFTINDLFNTAINSVGYTTFVSGSVQRVYTLVTPYAAADLKALKFSQANDVVTITHPNYRPWKLQRSGVINWAFVPDTFGTIIANLAAPALTTFISNPVATTAYAVFGYVVTSISQTGEESQASPPANTGIVPNIATQAGSVQIDIVAVTGAKAYNVYKSFVIARDVSAAPDFAVGVTYGFIGQTLGLSFVDTNIVPSVSKTPPIHTDPFAVKAIKQINMVTGGSAYSAGGRLIVTDPTGTGFSGVPILAGVYGRSGGATGPIVGVLILNGGSNYTNPTLSFPDTLGAQATATAILGPATGTYPSLSTYFQQRKVYAATLNQPETLWGTRIGLFSNMDVSTPGNDGDAYTFTLAALQLNDIKWTIPMPGGLVIFTGAGVYQLSGGGQNTPLTPSNAIANPQAYTGSADVQPIPINYDILYVQSKGSAVRDLSYNFFSNIYIGEDITILSGHLLSPTFAIIKWAYAEEPNRIIWAVRSDGALLSLTYVKEQKMNGWAQHATQGFYEDVAAIQEDTEDAVYFIVRRFINGRWMRYVERQASRRLLSGVSDAFFVDAGLSGVLNSPAVTANYSGNGITTVTVTLSAAITVPAIGSIFRGAGGLGSVTSATSTVLTVALTVPLTAVSLDNPTGGFLASIPGAWSVTPLVTNIFNLRHLNGSQVTTVADGGVQPLKTVVDGRITLDQPASFPVIGLPYICQLQTLPLDIGDPTIQGKRKRISAVNLRLVGTRGVKAGTDFVDMYELKETAGSLTLPLLTSVQRIIVGGGYDVGGQICIQQSYPLPVTILAVINEVSVGDR